MKYFIQNGKSDYAILLPANPSATLLQAGKELQEFAKKSTGVMLPIVREGENLSCGGYFSVGRTAIFERASLPADFDGLGDGFVIRSVGENIAVVAGTDRGFLYGVYEFIEQAFGVRFLTASETYIPKQKEVPVYAMKERSVPAFKLRTFLNYPTYPFGRDDAYTAHSRTLHNWFEHAENYGGKINVYSRKCGTHNARYFVPAEKYGTRESTGYEGEFAPDHTPHPEFYHSVEGFAPDWDRARRGPTIDWANGITEDGKLDESMEVSVAKVVIEEMKKDVLANPQAEFFLIDQEDFIDPVTDKALLEKYKASGVIIRFCNVVATELQKWADEELGGRRVNLVTFAYQQTADAPVYKNEKGEYLPIDDTVVPVDNLYIRLAYMSFHYYPYGDYRQPPVVKEMARSWSSICKRFWFWGYDSIFNDYLVYNPTIGQAEGTVRLMKDMGVEYFIMLSSYNAPNDWQAEMKSYYWTKLLWDSEADVHALQDEYIRLYYGVGAPAVREMMRIFDERYAEVVGALEPEHDEYNCYHEIGLPKNISVSLLDRAVEAIENGEKAVREAEIPQAEKDKLLVKLARVKLTPEWMKFKFFGEFYPNSTKEEKSAQLEKVLALADFGGITQKEEGHTLQAFVEKL